MKPPWFTGTSREWRSLKRRQFRDVLEAVDEFRRGCAYVSGYQEYELAFSKALEGWKNAMKVRNWK